MTKVRVYEVAKQLGVDENTALAMLAEQGANVKNRLSAVENDMFERVKRKVEQMKSPHPVVEENIRGGTVIRRKKPVHAAEDSKNAEATSSLHAPHDAETQAKSTTSFDLAHTEKVAGSELMPTPVAGRQRKTSESSISTTQAVSRRATAAKDREETPQAKVEVSKLADLAEDSHAPAISESESSSDSRGSTDLIDTSGSVEEKPVSPKRAETKREPASQRRLSVSASTLTKSSEIQAPEDVGAFEAATSKAKVGSKEESIVEPSRPTTSRTDFAQGTQSAESEQVTTAEAHRRSGDNSDENTGPKKGAQKEPLGTVLRRPGPAERSRAAVDPNEQIMSGAATGSPAVALEGGIVEEEPVETEEVVPEGDALGSSADPSRLADTPARKTGIETWTGRPGVPMPQTKIRSNPPPPQRRAGVQVDTRNTMQSRGMDARGLRGDSRSIGGPGDSRTGANVNDSGARGDLRGVGGSAQNRVGRNGSTSISGQRGMRSAGQGASIQAIKKAALPIPAEMSAHKKVVKIDEKITLATLAQKMSMKATDVLMKLMQMGMTGVNINSSLDADTAKLLASEFGWEVSDVAVSEESAIRELRGDMEESPALMEPRPPVVTVMGHVDHGKTSLLDHIRKAQVAAGEAGGITQHIGAYKVPTSKGMVTFLDTPGHEAFTAMRARGASVTDLVILVVAADDGVMPQTREAVNHARAAKVPIVVAINKIDKPEADLARVRRELMEIELIPEELGGDTLFVEVSAKTGKGVDELLETVALQAEMLELKASRRRPGTGTVVEAMLDRGKGPIARVLVRDGSIAVGDVILAGPAWGKIRAMTDEHGRPVQKAGPSTPVEILGLSDVPNAGDTVDVVRDPRKAQEFAEARGAKMRKNLLPSQAKVSLEDIVNRVGETDHLELRLVIKADVQGSVEAVTDALSRLSTEKVKVTVVHSAVGGITEGDVNLATAVKGIIIGFNVRPAGKATTLADTEGVQIRLYNIIYNAVDDVRKAMAGLLAPTIVEKLVGRAVIRQIFTISKIGIVAGSMVTDGTVKRAATKVRLIRDSVVVWEGKIGGLRHLKEDRREVEKGFECGIALEGYSDVKPGDFIECYDIEEVAATL